MATEHPSAIPYISEAWYPIATFDMLEGCDKKPLALRRLKMDLVIWQSGERILVMEDRCPHRSMRLSLGRLRGGHIECPYHGMQFSESGQLVKNPMQHPARICPPLQARVIPSRLAEGLLWIYFGNERDDLPEIPWPEEMRGTDDTYQTLGVTYPAGFYRLMESNFDIVHASHLHRNSSPVMGYIGSYRSTCQGSTITIDQTLIHPITEKRTRIQNRIMFPNLALARSDDTSLKNLIGCCPIDGKTSFFFVRFCAPAFNFPLAGPILNRLFLIYTQRVLLAEDFWAQSQQQGSDIGWDCDRPLPEIESGVLHFWRLVRQHLAAQGDRIDGRAGASRFSTSATVWQTPHPN